jgi:23S rRNA (uracil1939-C5)-methyltransferase
MSRKKRNLVLENLEVLDAGAKGKSIAKTDTGQVVFISNAVPGDMVDVQTHKKRKSYYEGKAIRFHKYSTKRVTPECTHFGTCGGCKWQYMAYEHQLFYKQKEVTNNLVRLGKIEIPEPAAIIASKKQYFYRNKLEFSFSDNRWITQDELNTGMEITDKNALGFHIPGMWDKILDIEKCHLQNDPSNAIRLEVKSFAVKNDLSFFNVRSQSGLLRTLMIRTATTGELMVLFQFYQNDKQAITTLLDHILKKFPEITSLQYVINEKANDTIYDQQVICYAGRDHIFEEMEGLKFKINAKSFYQTNSEQAYELYKVTRDFAGLTGKELVYDLYTGTGTIAQFIASKARKVIGIEAVPEAIEDAKKNAELNNITNTVFFSGDMKNIFREDFIAKQGKADVIITDPPRIGMHADVVHQILKVAPEKIVYVSCNSATQARDLALMNADYKVTRVQPVDMFPQTYHVENVVLLEKR